ncbi:MAG: hypothetical protein Q4F79_07255 [Eubacteriales bacterium]|nr:hypothetical protein [Eubacteriales bacterium]
MIDVVRKTCTAEVTEPFSFSTASVAFKVKNFTDDVILVCLGTWDENQSVMIQSGVAETVMHNPDPANYMTRDTTDTVLVKSTVSGVVEVLRND